MLILKSKTHTYYFPIVRKQIMIERVYAWATHTLGTSDLMLVQQADIVVHKNEIVKCRYDLNDIILGKIQLCANGYECYTIDQFVNLAKTYMNNQYQQFSDVLSKVGGANDIIQRMVKENEPVDTLLQMLVCNGIEFKISEKKRTEMGYIDDIKL